jgi:N-acetylglutamate synthase-like GNAT family acetyltransferase
MPSSHLKVTEIDGDLVGIAHVWVKGDIAELDRLFVEPSRLGSGSGREIFDRAKNTPWACQAGAATQVFKPDPTLRGSIGAC